jgi:uncharacterized membrane protein
MNNSDAVSKTLRRDIETLARLEQDSLKSRTVGERVADFIAGFSGTIQFVVLHVTFYGLWIVLNVGLVRFVMPWDPYPFGLLSLVISLEAILLSTFVLMKQNRMGYRADQRAKLDLQINLLAEREMTLVLQMLHRISTRLGVRPAAEEIEELIEETPIEALATELQMKAPPE